VRSSRKVNGKQVWDALKIIDHATVSLCNLLVDKHRTQRRAAKAIGVSTVHFCRMINGEAKASLDMLEVMSGEVDE